MDSFIPLFETLNWATSLEQYIRARWPSELSGSERWYDAIPYGQTVRSVQFARNCVHHDWAQALTLSDGDVDLPARVVADWGVHHLHLTPGNGDEPGRV